MSDALIKDLSPGTHYVLQVRSKDRNGNFSEWSTAYDLFTQSDITPPGPPTNLTWIVAGTSFKAKWNTPTVDSNGSALKDFKDFKVSISAPGKTASVSYQAGEEFDFPFESNIGAFTDPQPTVSISVQARDLAGNLSTAVNATVQNPVPSDVAGATFTGITSAISVSWNSVADQDIKFYRVHMSTSGSNFTPSNANKVYEGNNTSYIHPTTNPVPHYFKIAAIDVFNQPSANYASGSATPVSATDVDVTPPGAPTNVTVSATASDLGTQKLNISWTAPTQNAGDLTSYLVRYSIDGVTYSYATVPGDQTSVNINNVVPGQSYYVAVRSQDYNGNSSAWVNASTYPIAMPADTTAPGQPAAPTVSTNTLSAQVAHTGKLQTGANLPQDVSYLEVHASSTTNFTPSNTTLLGTLQSAGPGISINAIFDYPRIDTETQVYWKVIAVDNAKNKSIASPQATGLPGLIATSNIGDAQITNAKINSLSAAKLEAGTAITNNLFVRSTLTLDAAGSGLQSTNYNATNKTGYLLNNSGLTIYDGSVAAKSLLLQSSSQNLLPLAQADFEFVSSYYVDSAGAASGIGLSGGAAATILSIVQSGARYGNQALKMTNTTTTTGNGQLFYFGPGAASTTGVNIDVVATNYIVSGWVKKNGSANASWRLGFYTDTGTTIFPGTSSTINSSTWTRFSWVLTVPTGVNKVKLYAGVYANGSTGYDVTIDGLQVEEQIGALTTPSMFTPPSATTIDGGAIRTGSIQSSAQAIGVSGQPAWSINTQGNAQFGDALIRGTLTVGAGSDLVNSIVTSSNFTTGSAGWAIRGDGSAEFNNLITRGQASGSSAGYDTISATQSFLYKGKELSSMFSDGPRGIVARATGQSQVYEVTNGTRGLLEVACTIYKDRYYRITMEPMRTATDAIIAGTNQGYPNNWYIVFTYTNNGTTPTTTSPGIRYFETTEWAGARYRSIGGSGVFRGDEVLGGQTSAACKFLMVLGTVWNGRVYLNWDQIGFTIEDIGPATVFQSVNRYNEPATPTTQRYEFDIQPHTSNSYNGSGIAFNTGYTPSEVMWQGDANVDGNRRSWMWFDQTEIAKLQGVPLVNIEYCEVFIKIGGWWNPSGSVCLGWHNNTANVGATVEPAGGFANRMQVFYEGQGIGKWINLKNNSEIMGAIYDGSFKGFMLGNTGTTDKQTTGWAHGAARALGDKPGFRCAYWK